MTLLCHSELADNDQDNQMNVDVDADADAGVCSADDVLSMPLRLR